MLYVRSPRPAALSAAVTLACTIWVGGVHADIGDSDELVIETDDAFGSDEILIEESGDQPLGGGDELMIGSDTDDSLPDFTTDESQVRFGLDEARIEYGHQTDSNSKADSTASGTLAASVNWQPQTQWELQLAGRVDGHDQDGDNAFSTVQGDYGDS